MHVDFGIFAGLGKVGGELGGFDDGAVRDFFARVIANDHVGAAVVGGVEPEIVWLGYFESQVIVVVGGAAYQNLEAVGGNVAARAGNALGSAARRMRY